MRHPPAPVIAIPRLHNTSYLPVPKGRRHSQCVIYHVLSIHVIPASSEIINPKRTHQRLLNYSAHPQDHPILSSSSALNKARSPPRIQNAIVKLYSLSSPMVYRVSC